MKQVGKTERNWDIDLETGEYGENKLFNILSGSKIEVKYDLLAYETGNIAVEYESRGKKSGISTTEATYWAFILEELDQIVIIETGRLKKLCKRYWGNRITGGDKNSSKMVLVPLRDIWKV